jgi:hypothetical protein
MIASAIKLTILAVVVPSEIVIIGRELEEIAMMPMMIMACVTGLVLIPKAIFMPQAMAMGGGKGKT